MSFLGHAALRNGDYSGSIRVKKIITQARIIRTSRRSAARRRHSSGSEHRRKKWWRDGENSLARRSGGHRSLNSCGSSMLRNGGDPSITSHIVAPTDQMSTR